MVVVAAAVGYYPIEIHQRGYFLAVGFQSHQRDCYHFAAGSGGTTTVSVGYSHCSAHQKEKWSAAGFDFGFVHQIR